jgi:hypothetical protein
MTTTIHDEMHKEHRTWEAEISLWRDDIAVWEKELAETDGDFVRLKKVFDDRAETLRKHAATIRMLEQDSDTHEHALASFEQGGAGDVLVQFAKKHVNESKAQENHRTAHEELKRHHHALMSQWKVFVRTFAAENNREQASSQLDVK